jgi:hypothetical protein
MAFRPRTVISGALALVTITTSALVFGHEADAFKPYTHTQTGYAAWADATDDGMVTIGGQQYEVPDRVVLALQTFPSYYNAGVIGPDGFPDLAMGQSVVHPEHTGQWLAFLLDAAWDAQQPGAAPSGGAPYSEDEKLQILAFTYGFLTHAAGDSWAHTMVNELSEGIFPGVGEILTDADMAAIALRHLLVEGYVGAATAGYDNDPNEAQLPSGDVSDDSTAGIAFNAPGRFVYDTLVRQGNGAPTDSRGPVIGFFLGLRGELDAFLTSTPDPLGEAIEAYDEFKAEVESFFAPGHCDGIDNDGDGDIDEGCSFPYLEDEDNSGPCSFGVGDSTDGAVFDIASDIIECPIALGVSLVSNTIEGALEAAGEALLLALKPVLDAYVGAWIEDIDAGLAAWSELGLATTKGLFDPQTRRDAQNDECDSFGADVITPEDADDEINPRRVCENGVGVIDTVLYASDDFINDHLLSMLGAPDVIGDLRELLGEIADLLDDILGPALNPLRQIGNAINEFATDLIKDALSERFGIDVEQIESLLTDPTTRVDIETLDLGPLGTINVLGPDVRATLDGYLGLESHDPFEPLANGEVFTPAEFAAYDNTTTLAKLLLLDGPALDGLLSDLVDRPYTLYNTGDPRSNIMTATLPGAPGDPTEWLRLIDGDHPWRQDGQPVFPPGNNHGGNGNMPLFESCVLRDMGFRALFDDWENDDTPGIGNNNGVLDPAEDFPGLGDTVSTDPNDPLPPTSALVVGTPSVVDGTTTWVTPATSLTINPDDDFWFDTEIDTAISIDGTPSTSVAAGVPFTLAGHADGLATVGHQPSDPCRTGALTSNELTVDGTPPTVSITVPVADPPSYDTDDFVPVAYTADDGVGVGVDASTFEVRLDGTLVSDAFVIDTYLLDAGLHTLKVSVADKLGNVGESTVSFRVRATSASLLNNIIRARSEGLITSTGTYNSLVTTVQQAVRSHNKAKHETEWNQLVSARNVFVQDAPVKIDQATATRFIGYIDDLIAAGG